MNKDAKNDHRYFLFLSNVEDENRLRIYADKWFAVSFPNAFLHFSTIHKVKVNNVCANAVIDDLTNRPTKQAKKTISESTGFTITKFGWLSSPGKKYGPMVLHLSHKKESRSSTTTRICRSWRRNGMHGSMD